MPYFDCEVISAGPQNDGKIYVWLNNVGEGPRFSQWYTADRSVQNEMLATALAAATSGQLVSAALKLPTEQYSNIDFLYLWWPGKRSGTELAMTVGATTETGDGKASTD